MCSPRSTAPRPRAASASRPPTRARRRASRPRGRPASATPASAAGTRRSGRRGSRSSRGTRRRNVPAPSPHTSTSRASVRSPLQQRRSLRVSTDADPSARRHRRPDDLHRPADGAAAERRPELQGVPERDRDRDPALPALGRAHGGGRAGRGRRSTPRDWGALRWLCGARFAAASRSACSASSTTTLDEGAAAQELRSARARPRPAEFERSHFTGLSPARWLALLHRDRDRPAQLLRGPRDRPVGRAGRSASPYVLVIGFGLHNATEGFGIVAPLVGRGRARRAGASSRCWA